MLLIKLIHFIVILHHEYTYIIDHVNKNNNVNHSFTLTSMNYINMIQIYDYININELLY